MNGTDKIREFLDEVAEADSSTDGGKERLDKLIAICRELIDCQDKDYAIRQCIRILEVGESGITVHGIKVIADPDVLYFKGG